MKSYFSYRRQLQVVAAFAGLTASACQTTHTLVMEQTLPWYGFEGRWAGPVTPKDPSCGDGHKGVMKIAGEKFVFDPFQSTIVLAGSFDPPTGRLAGQLERPGADKKPLTLSFSGQAKRDASSVETIEGELVSSHCHWDIRLIRG